MSVWFHFPSSLIRRDNSMIASNIFKHSDAATPLSFSIRVTGTAVWQGTRHGQRGRKQS